MSITSRDLEAGIFVYTPTPGTLTFSLPASTYRVAIRIYYRNNICGSQLCIRVLVPMITVFRSSVVFLNDSIRSISTLARFHFSGYNDVSRGGEDQYVSCPATVHRFFHSGITIWPTNLMCCYILPFMYLPSVLPDLLSFFLP